VKTGSQSSAHFLPKNGYLANFFGGMGRDQFNATSSELSCRKRGQPSKIL